MIVILISVTISVAILFFAKLDAFVLRAKISKNIEYHLINVFNSIVQIHHNFKNRANYEFSIFFAI